MANCDSCPERRSRSKDKAGKVRADRVKVIKVRPRQRRAQIKAQARDKVMAADGAAAEIRINNNVGG